MPGVSKWLFSRHHLIFFYLYQCFIYYASFSRIRGTKHIAWVVKLFLLFSTSPSSFILKIQLVQNNLIGMNFVKKVKHLCHFIEQQSALKFIKKLTKFPFSFPTLQLPKNKQLRHACVWHLVPDYEICVKTSNYIRKVFKLIAVLLEWIV